MRSKQSTSTEPSWGGETLVRLRGALWIRFDRRLLPRALLGALCLSKLALLLHQTELSPAPTTMAAKANQQQPDANQPRGRIHNGWPLARWACLAQLLPPRKTPSSFERRDAFTGMSLPLPRTHPGVGAPRTYRAPPALTPAPLPTRWYDRRHRHHCHFPGGHVRLCLLLNQRFCDCDCRSLLGQAVVATSIVPRTRGVRPSLPRAAGAADGLCTEAQIATRF
jgi:hypothetical protein